MKNEKIYKYHISWKAVVISAILCGVITGIILCVPFLKNTSICNIGICFEFWILCAVIISYGSDKPLEAGFKVFIFFLISQPLVYLTEVPFSPLGFSLFRYYPPWFIYTLLTFPGAIVAWYTKKQSWASVIIFSIANLMLNDELVIHFYFFVRHFPKQLFAIIFIILQEILYCCSFKEKNKKIVFIIIDFMTLVISIIWNYI